MLIKASGKSRHYKAFLETSRERWKRKETAKRGKKGLRGTAYNYATPKISGSPVRHQVWQDSDGYQGFC